MYRLWEEDAGSVYLEYLILSTIIGLGVMVGAGSLRSSMTVEFSELSASLLSTDGSVSVDGLASCLGTVDAVVAVDGTEVLSTTDILTTDPALSTSNTAISIDAMVCP